MILRLETFRSLGGATEIVRAHLERALTPLSPGEQDLAARVFHHSTRVFAGGGRGPSRSDEKVRWVFPVSQPDDRFWCRHHLTSPLLRNGSLPLPRCAAERTQEATHFLLKMSSPPA